MQHPHLQKTAKFDHVAHHYDVDFTTTTLGRLLRKRVWHFLKTKFKSQKNLHILELNGGTGEDAIWMAEMLDAQIWLTDQSPQMLKIAQQKITEKNLDSHINIQTCPIENVVQQFRHQQFDLIFSNFGGLNCLSPPNLKTVCSELTTLLKPNGTVLTVVMGKFCWWESLYFVLKNQKKNAFRRCSPQKIIAKLDEHTTVDVWYFSPDDVKNMFTPRSNDYKMAVEAVLPIGFWLPPSYLNPFFSKKTTLLQLLNCLENYSQHPVFARASDHFLIFFRKL